jgi:hypothetical protein
MTWDQFVANYTYTDLAIDASFLAWALWAYKSEGVKKHGLWLVWLVALLVGFGLRSYLWGYKEVVYPLFVGFVLSNQLHGRWFLFTGSVTDIAKSELREATDALNRAQEQYDKSEKLYDAIKLKRRAEVLRKFTTAVLH